MSSSFHNGAPHAGPSWRSHRDGDQAAASFPHGDITTVAPKATKMANRSGQDELSVPVSPPSSDIAGERGAADCRTPHAGNQAAMSGNIEQPGDRANGSMSTESNGTRSDDNDDSQAISAVALLLLAASATSQTKLPVASGAAGGGKSVHEWGFPACADGCRENNLRRGYSASLYFSPLSCVSTSSKAFVPGTLAPLLLGALGAPRRVCVQNSPWFWVVLRLFRRLFC